MLSQFYARDSFNRAIFQEDSFNVPLLIQGTDISTRQLLVVVGGGARAPAQLYCVKQLNASTPSCSKMTHLPHHDLSSGRRHNSPTTSWSRVRDRWDTFILGHVDWVKWAASVVNGEMFKLFFWHHCFYNKYKLQEQLPHCHGAQHFPHIQMCWIAQSCTCWVL